MERFPGAPGWSSYPTTKSIPTPEATLIVLRDDRCNLTLQLLKFSSTNYTGNSSNPSPNGIVPIDSIWTLWPKRETGEVFFLDYILTSPADGVRGTELPILYYFDTEANKGVGNLVVWDPDITVMFRPPATEEEQVAYGAIAGGVVAGVVVISAGVTIALLYRRNKRLSMARIDVLERLQLDKTEDGSRPAAEPTNPPAGWDSTAINNHKRDLKHLK
jgi:hypothetical protein